MGWNGYSATSMAIRFYYNPGPTLPSKVIRLADIRNSTATAARVELSASNQLFIQNAAGTTLTTFADPLQANTWYRIELTISISASSGDDQRCVLSGGFDHTGRSGVFDHYRQYRDGEHHRGIDRFGGECDVDRHELLRRSGCPAGVDRLYRARFMSCAVSEQPTSHPKSAAIPSKLPRFVKTRPGPSVACYVRLIHRAGGAVTRAGWDASVSVGDSCQLRVHSLGGNVMRKVLSSVLVGVTSLALLSTTVIAASAATTTAGSTCNAIDAPKSMNDMPASADCPTPGAALHSNLAPLVTPVQATSPISATPLRLRPHER